MESFNLLKKAFSLEKADRPPILGGWLAAPEHIQTLTGCSAEEYWDNPKYWEVAAERVLGSDGLVDIFVPISREEFRCVNTHVLEERAQYTVEAVLEEIAHLPEVDQIRVEFDEEAEYRLYREEFQARQELCRELLWCPADWSILPTALWYGKYGYETALTTLAWHPEEYRKLIRTSAERGHLRARLVARAIREGIHPGAILTGEDLCSQQGSIASPAFLRQEYWRLVEYSFLPLLEVGAKLIWHCDGNYQQILSDVLATGVAGLQGFQKECGMDLEWIGNLRTKTGDPLIIFGPMEVTTTLHDASPPEIQRYVREVMDFCREKVSLVFFTSNTLTPDIPLENILTYWSTVRESHW
jgi:hypothetical protein